MNFNEFREKYNASDKIPTHVPTIDTDYIWKTCVAIANDYTKFIAKPNATREKEQSKLRKKYAHFVSTYPTLANKMLDGPDSETMQTRLENVKDMLRKIKLAQSGAKKIEDLHVEVGQEYWAKYNPLQNQDSSS